MGNQATKPLPDAEEKAETDDATKTVVPRPISSSSLSSVENEVAKTPSAREETHNDDDEGSVNEKTVCSKSVSENCTPSVLSFYRKEDPLLLRPNDDEDNGDNHSEDDDDSHCEADLLGQSPKRGRSSSGEARHDACSARQRRRRSWSPKHNNNRRGFFFSKYTVNSSSTSSLSSLIAKTKQQLITSGYNDEEKGMIDGHLPTPESDLNRLRDYFIITTAALPWFTGTAVNPLLRAASLSRFQRQQFAPNRSTVTLVVPWLDLASDRQLLYGDEWQEKTQADQEAFIRDWLSKANMPEEALPPEQGGIRILFYPARYHAKLSSIFAMGDLCDFIVSQNNLTIREDAVCVLEEPEHLHFYRDTKIRDHFGFVVGIIHTNYKAYASSAIPAGSFITGPLIGAVSSWLVRAYCDRVIKLSPVLQSFDCLEKESVCNVHGIRNDFIVEGERRAQSASHENGKKIYFVGKLLWQKGLDKLLELEALYRNHTGEYFPIDIYGSGPDQEDIELAFLSERPKFLGRAMSYGSNSALDELANDDEGSETPDSSPPTSKNSTSIANNRRGLYYSTFVRPKPPVPANFMGREDHAKLTSDYKIFVNPSVTEVLCTTTAEATAMGKFVLIPDHPSNSFFHQFPNCLLYKNKHQFVDFLQYAITHDPEPLGQELIHKLTWEAATQRFIKAAAVSRRDAKWRERVGKTKKDEKLAKMHYELGKGTKGDVIRKVLGGGPVAHQSSYDLQLQRSEEEEAASCPPLLDDDRSINSSEVPAAAALTSASE